MRLGLGWQTQRLAPRVVDLCLVRVGVRVRVRIRARARIRVS